MGVTGLLCMDGADSMAVEVSVAEFGPLELDDSDSRRPCSSACCSSRSSVRCRLSLSTKLYDIRRLFPSASCANAACLVRACCTDEEVVACDWLLESVFERVRRAGPRAATVRGGDLRMVVLVECLFSASTAADVDAAADTVVARARTLLPALESEVDVVAVAGMRYGSKGMNESDSDARPSLLVSRDALGLVCCLPSLELLLLLLPGDPLPAVDAWKELLLLCTSESGCLRGEKVDMVVGVGYRRGVMSL